MPLYTPIQDGDPGNAATFNSRFDEIANAISTSPSTISVITPWTVLVADTSTITISSIPATYASLNLVALLRTNVAAAVSDMLLRPNNDSTQANYYLRRVVGGSAVSTASQLGTGFAGFFFDDFLCGASAPSNHYAILNMTIYRYTETTYAKHILFDGYTHSTDLSAGMFSLNGGGSWRGTNAISSLVMEAVSGNFVIGSAYALYGVL